MPSTQTFPNGRTLTTTALTPDEIQALFQQITCFIFGITNKLPFNVSLEAGNNQVVFPSVVGIADGYKITDVPGFGLSIYGSGGYGSGGNIPDKTTITGIVGNVVTLSHAPTATVDTTVFVTDPIAGATVRQAWPTKGAPAYGVNDNVTFVSGVEIDSWYNKVADETTKTNLDDSVSILKEYTRVWDIRWELRGPGSYDRGRLLKTTMQFDFIHDMVAPFGLYLVPNVGNPVRVPEHFEGQWLERAGLNMHFNEQVNESIVTPTVTSIEVIVETAKGVVLDIQAP